MRLSALKTSSLGSGSLIVAVAALLLLLISSDVNAQVAVGDSVVQKDKVNLRQNNSFPYGAASAVYGSNVFVVEAVSDDNDFLQVTHEGTTGWIRTSKVSSLKSIRAKEEASRERERKEAEQQKRERREREEYLQSFRDQGYGILLSSLVHQTNSADGVSVQLRFKSIETEKRIKYIAFTLRPFNTVGDAVRGRTKGESTTEVRGVGPIEPGENASYMFKNVWYNGTIDCIEIRKVEVEYFDGSSFTYVNDLKNVLMYPDRKNINLRGVCSVV